MLSQFAENSQNFNCPRAARLAIERTNHEQNQIKAQSHVRPAERREILWKKPTFKIDTGVDTEYVSQPDHPNIILTTQVALSANRDDCSVLEHPKLGLNIMPTWSGKSILSSVLGWNEVDASENQIDGYLLWNNMMFWAPSDVLAGLFREIELCRYVQRFYKQDARIRIDSGKKGRYQSVITLPIFLDTPHGLLQQVLKITDYGKLANGSLKKTAEALGVKMMNKDLLDDHKSDMLKAYLNLLDQYLIYGKDDACVPFDLRDANERRVKKLFDVHSLPTPKKEITTTGTMASKLLTAYLDDFIGEHRAYEFFTSRDQKTGKHKEWKLNDMLKKTTVAHMAQMKETSKAAGALIQGGRAKNELPLLIKILGVVADIDLTAAYVSILMSLYFPVGLPASYGVHESNKRVTKLDTFLKKNQSELMDRMYEILIKVPLNHRQNLVNSKVIDTIDINSKYSEDNPKIPADFRLYTDEAINAVITSDVLETLKNTCSAKEYYQWMQAEVVCAFWYPRSLMCKTPEEWYEKTAQHVEKYGNEVVEYVTPQGETRRRDKRSRYWLAVPMADFLKPYREERERLKGLMKQCPKDSDEYTELDAQQGAMKLVGNVIWGILASPYFNVGNVVIANVVTAAARVAVWCTSTALGCAQSITDGGAYNANAVNVWHNKKPTLNTLSSLRNRKLLHKSVAANLSTKPLASETPWTLSPGKDDEHSIMSNGTETYEANESNWKHFDKAALNHVRDFFRDDKNPISLLDLICYEHKDFYVKGVFQSQTNYRFTHTSGENKTKARGHKLEGSPYEGDECSNVHNLFEDLDRDPTRIPAYKPQQISQILKCNQANEMLESKTDNILKQNNLLAGDSICKNSWLRPISLSMFHWQYDSQYVAWERVVDSLKQHSGWGLEQFFLNKDGTLDYQRAIEEIQAAIDNGQDWLFPGVKGKPKDRVVAYHPYYNKKNPVNIPDSIDDLDEDE